MDVEVRIGILTLIAFLITAIGGCALPVIQDGYIDQKNGGYMPGDRVPLQCNAGRFLSPRQSPIITCQSDGTWKTESGIMPSCTRKQTTNPSKNIA